MSDIYQRFKINPSKTSPLIFAAIFAVGLFAFTPGFGLTLRAIGLPGYVGPLIALALTIGCYALFVLLSGRWFTGSLVALLMLTTYGANIPVGDTSQYPMNIGPAIWAFQAPLIAAIVLGVRQGLHKIETSRAEVLLLGFVVWSGIIAIVSNAPRPDVALFFTLFFLQAFLVFSLVIRSVRSGIVEFRDIIGVLCITAIGHVSVGIIQFANEGPLGLPVLGETHKIIGTIGLGPVVLRTGAWVSGFAIGGINSLIILTFPAIAVFSWRRGTSMRTAGALSILAMLIVQRGTASDSARGAIFLTALIFVAGLLWLRRGSVHQLARVQNLPVVGQALFAAAIVLVPASGAGSKSSPTLGKQPTPPNSSSSVSAAPGTTQSTTTTTTTAPTPTATDTANTTTTATTTTPTTTAQNTTHQTTTTPPTSTTTTPTTTTQNGTAAAPGGSQTTTQVSGKGRPTATDLVNNMSVPFFSLRSLGVRIEQWAAGIDLFLRNPIFGIGGGNFMFYAESYGLSKAFRMHSLYVALLAETGLPGFLLYLGAVCVALFSGGKLLFSRDADRILVLAVCCSLVGLLGAAAWGPFLDKLPRVFPFWALLGSLVGYYHWEAGKSSSHLRA